MGLPRTTSTWRLLRYKLIGLHQGKVAYQKAGKFKCLDLKAETCQSKISGVSVSSEKRNVSGTPQNHEARRMDL